MTLGVFPVRQNALSAIFGPKKKVIIGVIHSLALPGSPFYRGQSLSEVYDFAVREALAYQEGGVDGLIVENAWDIPFSKPEDIGYETVATMAVMAQKVSDAVSLPIGINILANAAIPALAVAKSVGARFVRVNQWVNAYVANEGFVEGAAAKALRYREWIKATDVRVFADVHVKHGSHSIVADRPLAEQARDAEWFAADVLIATGARTGGATPLEEARTIKEATELPVIIGSGLTVENAGPLLEIVDGAIVASSLKREGVWWNPVDVDRVKRLMDVVAKYR